MRKKKIELVAGGEHRQQSVEQALNAICAAADDVILVHDAVRPLVTHEVIHEVIAAAKKYGAAIAGLHAVDTVKQVERTAEGAIVKATIPRASVVLAQRRNRSASGGVAAAYSGGTRQSLVAAVSIS